MYAIHSCLAGQPDGGIPAQRARQGGLILHLQENRSHLSRDARVTFTVLIAVFMAMAILPALRGQWLVPGFAIGSMALLVGVLDWHRRTRPAAEWLALDQGRLLWRSLAHETVEWPIFGTRFVIDDAVPARLRLFLEHRARRIEIATCLGLEERRAVADLITRELAAARQGAAPQSF
ncbi:DUF2244 domain-containing protein [Erythrobacter sp. WG]|uniref:DUF2244 domain-containing protein n=1 Tax=Erythrobacter sp. WG TaxID=2985510 RepID=UPI00226EFAA8|nr:DUF2244 domain-containing protein [Erythrobacter sp. WG]MCX9146018.1 DUF2244 domain-containing protein [Erythrobacter sp. WG]